MKMQELRQKLERYPGNYDVVFSAPDAILDWDYTIHCVADSVLIVQLKKLANIDFKSKE